MKFLSTTSSFLVVLSSLVAVVVFGEEGVDATTNNDAAIAEEMYNEIHHRELQATCESTPAWHPDYSAGWDRGKCDFTTTCNSPSYSTNLACCKGAPCGVALKSASWNSITPYSMSALRRQ